MKSPLNLKKDMEKNYNKKPTVSNYTYEDYVRKSNDLTNDEKTLILSKNRTNKTKNMSFNTVHTNEKLSVGRF